MVELRFILGYPGIAIPGYPKKNYHDMVLCTITSLLHPSYNPQMRLAPNTSDTKGGKLGKYKSQVEFDIPLLWLSVTIGFKFNPASGRQPPKQNPVFCWLNPNS